jgi:hypothetical protein
MYRHFLPKTAIALGAILATSMPVRQVSAQDIVRFTSVPLAGDLSCPITKIPSPVEHASAVAGGNAPQTKSQVPAGLPSPEELGPFQKTTIREQPLIVPDTIPGLLVNSSTAYRRIAIWGDSHIAAGPFLATLISGLEVRGISVGSHFLPPSMGRANTRPLSVRMSCVGPGWTTEQSYMLPSQLETGPGLINRIAIASPESYLWLDLRTADQQPVVRMLQLTYSGSEDAVVSIGVNDGQEQRIALRKGGGPHILTIYDEKLVSTIKLKLVKGEVTLQGFTLDYAQPPVITFDAFGLPSSTVKGWANASPSYMTHTLNGWQYDGVMLEYGTNEGNDPDYDPKKYTALLTKALTNVRQVFPRASCVLIGPPDRGVLRLANQSAADLLRFSRIHQQIEQIQRTVGRQFNCVAWNWQDLMGGPGGSYGWALGTPSLMNRDLTHLSPEGYKRTAHALAQSLGWEPIR